jgi:hypothetical protein
MLVAVFTTLFEDVCQKFNISVTVLGSYNSGNGTNVTVMTPPQPSIEPSTGFGERATAGPHMSWLLSGALYIAAFAIFL